MDPSVSVPSLTSHGWCQPMLLPTAWTTQGFCSFCLQVHSTKLMSSLTKSVTKICSRIRELLLHLSKLLLGYFFFLPQDYTLLVKSWWWLIFSSRVHLNLYFSFLLKEYIFAQSVPLVWLFSFTHLKILYSSDFRSWALFSGYSWILWR